MQQQLFPELDSNTVELSSTNYNGQTIHSFKYHGQIRYFVSELDKAFGIYTFKHHATQLAGERMYVRVNDDVTQARIITNAVHIKTLRVNGQGVDRVSTGCRHDVRKVSGRYERIAISEKGIFITLKNSPYREKVFQQLGITVTEGNNMPTSSTLPTGESQTITLNLVTQIGKVAINITLNEQTSERAKIIMADVKDIATIMLG